jgi:hypothetical protein
MEKDLQDEVSGELTEVFKRTIFRTPVDTGRLRSNWQTGISVTPSGEKQAGNNALSQTQSEMKKYELGDTVFFANNLPYAVPIEEGHSKAFPEGMLKVSVLEVFGVLI